MPTLQEAREHSYGIVRTSLSSSPAIETYYMSAASQLEEPLPNNYVFLSFIHTGSVREGLGNSQLIRSTANLILEINVPIQISEAPEDESEAIATRVRTQILADPASNGIFLTNPSLNVIGRIEAVWRTVLTVNVIWYNH